MRKDGIWSLSIRLVGRQVHDTSLASSTVFTDGTIWVSLEFNAAVLLLFYAFYCLLLFYGVFDSLLLYTFFFFSLVIVCSCFFFCALVFFYRVFFFCSLIRFRGVVFLLLAMLVRVSQVSRRINAISYLLLKYLGFCSMLTTSLSTTMLCAKGQSDLGILLRLFCPKVALLSVQPSFLLPRAGGMSLLILTAVKMAAILT